MNSMGKRIGIIIAVIVVIFILIVGIIFGTKVAPYLTLKNMVELLQNEDYTFQLNYSRYIPCAKFELDTKRLTYKDTSRYTHFIVRYLYLIYRERLEMQWKAGGHCSGIIRFKISHQGSERGRMK